MVEIRVAIAGVGNCASALVQGIQYYRDVREDDDVPGLMHVNFGGYHVKDIRFVTAFDVSTEKIGTDLAEAIFSKPNCCAKFSDVANLGVEVSAGPILDGVASHMSRTFTPHDGLKITEETVTKILEDADTDVLVNYLPVGSKRGTRFYAKVAVAAKCAFVNCIPEFIASDPKWERRFERRGLPVAGDDIKSQLGATILHRNLARLCLDRGVIIDETYQLNLGGNTDFQNMTVEGRLKTKRISKTEAVTSLIPYDVPTRIGPSDFVPFLGDKKVCYVLVKGRKFGGQPVRIRAKLEVEDSPNSAGVVIDVIRAVKLALDRNIAGSLVGVSSYAFKHPPKQVPDSIAKQWVEDYIIGKRRR